VDSELQGATTSPRVVRKPWTVAFYDLSRQDTAFPPHCNASVLLTRLALPIPVPLYGEFMFECHSFFFLYV